jgi:CubicO group peptidase (beta-lactamase class C family)
MFQIGSLTKLYTAVLIGQCVDAGLLDWDEPAFSRLPEVRAASKRRRDLLAPVTIRHLLNHTSGLVGDLFVDTGENPDAVSGLVARLVTLEPEYAVGAELSYCNSGYSVLGRLVEVVRERDWRTAVRDLIVDPLRGGPATAEPDEIVRQAFAVGHAPAAGQRFDVMPRWRLPRSVDPAGGISATARSTLAFALSASRPGSALISDATVAEMTGHHVAVSNPASAAGGWGLGWCHYRTDGAPVLGHDGLTLGQAAFLRLVPTEDFALVLLTNGGRSGQLLESLRQLWPQLPARPAVADHDALPVEPSQGTYERRGMTAEVVEVGDRCTAVMTAKDEVAEIWGAFSERLTAPRIGTGTYHATDLSGVSTALHFGQLDGRPYLQSGIRMHMASTR